MARGKWEVWGDAGIDGVLNSDCFGLSLGRSEEANKVYFTMGVMFLLLFLALFGIVVAIVVTRNLFTKAICLPIIEEWAKSNGLNYTATYVWGFEGPFVHKTNSQTVYRIDAVTGDETKVAYVKIGHWFFGLLWPKLSVRWIE